MAVYNVSGFGVSVVVVSTKSFPSGFQLSKFADESDPIQIADMEPTDFEKLHDGSLFFYQKAAPIRITLSVLAGTDDDENLRILLASRKSSAGVIALPDTCTLTLSYPNSSPTVFTNGSIVGGPPADSVSSNGRRKSNAYQFVFGAVSGYGSSSFASTLGTIGGLIAAGQSIGIG